MDMKNSDQSNVSLENKADTFHRKVRYIKHVWQKNELNR